MKSKTNEALKLLLDVPNIDVNIVNNDGESALHVAASCDNSEAVELLLNVPNIDVNILDNQGMSAVHQCISGSMFGENIEVLKLLLAHPNLTTFTLNHKDKFEHSTPVMEAVKMNRLEELAVLIADLRVDLDTTDREGRSLEERAW